MLAELTIAAARRTEQALGPAAALLVIGAALETAEGEARRTLLLAALGCATRAGDAGAFASLVGRWASSDEGQGDPRASSLVARLARAGHAELARRLAKADVARHRSAHALFALAALDDDAALFREAAALAAGTELAERATRAALHRAPPEHADEAEAVLRASPNARDVLRLAPSALASPRLYARVRTLDRLAELAAMAHTRTAALRIALAHADLRGAALGELERDRVLAIARTASAPASVIETLAGTSRPESEQAAREALMGHAPSTEPADRASAVALRALAAVVAEQSSASLLLSALLAHPPSPAGWTAVLAGLARPATRAAAVSCAEAWLALDIAPPRGFAVLAAALERADAGAAAERAWSQALRANEDGARRRLGAILSRRARDAYAAGDREGAKALLERSLAIDPSSDR